MDITKSRETGRRDYDVDKIIAHPDYRYPMKYNDIALLSTYKKIEFSKVVRPACLYTKTDVQQKVAVATGWGQKGI